MSVGTRGRLHTPKSPGQKKAAEKAKLEKIRTVTFTVEASEEVLQRLAALLLFTTPAGAPKYTYQDDDPMPWEPERPPVPTLEESVDFEAVRRSIAKNLSEYQSKHGTDQAREVLKSFGAERLSLISEAQLLDLNAALAVALIGKTAKSKPE